MTRQSRAKQNARNKQGECTAMCALFVCPPPAVGADPRVCPSKREQAPSVVPSSGGGVRGEARGGSDEGSSATGEVVKNIHTGRHRGLPLHEGGEGRMLLANKRKKTIFSLYSARLSLSLPINRRRCSRPASLEQVTH